MTILGIGGIFGGAACAVLKDGELAAAAEEAKIARYVTPGELPEHAIQTCLAVAKVEPEQVDCVAIVRPFADSPASPLNLQLRERFPNSRLTVVEHHVAHAASAYYVSPFDDAVVLTLDRLGDVRCGARWHASGNNIQLEKELYIPDSIGDLYARVTALLGFEPGADEHKVQWLSTAGDDRFTEVFESMFDWTEDWPRINRNWLAGERHRMGGFSRRFYRALELDADQPSSVQRVSPHVAAGLQRAVERVVSRMAGSAERLCLAGGLGLNVLLVSALERDRQVFVQPAAGNAGTALGAVLHAWHSVYGETKRPGIGNLCLGPAFTEEQTKQVLENCKLRFRFLLTSEEVVEEAVQHLADNQIVAWMHGRMEFGPRALGNRSILASPLNKYSTENLNVYIKHREPFRKFAASVIAEAADEYFEVGPNARYLATVGRVRPAHRQAFESAILGTDMVRVHKVHREDNPLFYSLLEESGRRTGLPVLYNTSFNLFGDPLVCSPRDAARSFYSSGIDSMFVGKFLMEK
jgi:carbamoyltransferase